MQTLNLATSLPTEVGPLDHDCKETIDKVYSSWPDLTDIPFLDPELDFYMDGSSFVQGGQCKARCSLTTTEKVIKAEALPQGWLAQQAEVLALVQALRYAEGKRVNIYTDSKYAFAMLHIHGAIYKERGLRTAGGKEIKNKEEILQLLEAAVIHCKGHQKGKDPISKGNQLAGQAAKEAAGQWVPEWEPSLRSCWHQNCPLLPIILKKRINGPPPEGGKKEREGWWRLLDQTFHPQYNNGPVSNTVPSGKNCLRKPTKSLLPYSQAPHPMHPDQPLMCGLCPEQCQSKPRPSPGVQAIGTMPFEDLEVDFTEVKPCQSYRYLLVLVCTYSGWVEAFPT